MKTGKYSRTNRANFRLSSSFSAWIKFQTVFCLQTVFKGHSAYSRFLISCSFISYVKNIQYIKHQEILLNDSLREKRALKSLSIKVNDQKHTFKSMKSYFFFKNNYAVQKIVHANAKKTTKSPLQSLYQKNDSFMLII